MDYMLQFCLAIFMIPVGKEQQALNPAAINGAETEEEIDLVEVFYLLWGHILQIIACFLAGALLAFGFTYFFVVLGRFIPLGIIAMGCFKP